LTFKHQWHLAIIHCGAGMSERAKPAGGLSGTLRVWLKDLVLTLALVVVLCGALFLYAGVWPPLVSVEGTSMYPHMQDGDLVILRGLDRVPVNASYDAVNENYKKFNGYGDVIVYSPMGNKTRVPVIHRAIYWVNQGQPMWPDGPLAPWSGYITLGDNNFFYDQSSSISPDEPVKPEWILGVSQYKIPYLGLLRTFI
jgi:signal peptidase I